MARAPNSLQRPGQLLLSLLLATLGSWNTAQAQGQEVSSPFTQTRASAFTYYGPADGVLNGLIKSETIEPTQAEYCVTTTYSYDAFGNKTGATTNRANCPAGASATALFDARGSSSTYGANSVTIASSNGNIPVTVPAGYFATTSTNALGQSESRQIDPRFGTLLSLTGPNQLTTNWRYDNFGRKTKETRADGTQTLTAYCYISGRVLDASSNTSISSGDPLDCPSNFGPGEVPLDAISFAYSISLDASGKQIGPFARIYSDRCCAPRSHRISNQITVDQI